MSNNSKEKLIKEIKRLREKRGAETLSFEELDRFDVKKLENVLKTEEKMSEAYAEKNHFDKRFIPLIIVPLILFATFYVFFMSQKLSRTMDYTNIINECSPKIFSSYIVCCLNGNLSLCTDQKIFNPNQFLIVRANTKYLLSAYNISWKSYYICDYTELDSTGVKASTEFSSHTAFTGTSGSLSIFCSTKFNLEETHIVRDFGFVPNKSSFKLLEIRIFPDHDYKKLEDFDNYLNESKVLLSEEGIVE